MGSESALHSHPVRLIKVTGPQIESKSKSNLVVILLSIRCFLNCIIHRPVSVAKFDPGKVSRETETILRTRKIVETESSTLGTMSTGTRGFFKFVSDVLLL